MKDLSLEYFRLPHSIYLNLDITKQKKMADSFTQIDVHVVFAVKYRASLIDESWEDQLHKYISGIVALKGHKMIRINGMHDHIHMLIDLKPTQGLSELVREIKKSSTAYVNEMKLTHQHFQWQNGYAGFAVYRPARDIVIEYIKDQKQHHRSKSFKTEYYDLLKEHKLDFKEEHLFDWL